MQLLTGSQMRELERRYIECIGMPSISLMENAASMLSQSIENEYKGLKNTKIVIVAGKGNNGGDTLAAYRHLVNKGANVRVFLLCEKDEIKGDAKINLDILLKLEVDIICPTHINFIEEIEKAILNADIIIDGIFGTGFKGQPSGLIAQVIALINAVNNFTVSVDLPSGLDADTGMVSGVCVVANLTVTFGFPKVGLIIHPGCEYTGKLKVVDIGIIKGYEENLGIYLIDNELARSILPARTENSNKGTYGKALIITGSKGMAGAGCLCGKAFLRSGAGLAYLCVPESMANIYNSSFVEGVIRPLKDEDGYLSDMVIDEIKMFSKDMDVVVIGPGIGTKDGVKRLVKKVITDLTCQLVIDADALNCISDDVEILKRANKPVIITPHPGEMARLLGITVTEVQNNRIDITRCFSTKYGTITILKGSRTIISTADGELYINCTGNSGMATAGTGDVLAGIVAGLLAQKVKPVDAAVLGVYLHGVAGDIGSREKTQYSLIASDLIEFLPSSIKACLENVFSDIKG